MAYQIDYLTQSEYAEWDTFVDRSPQGSIYSKSYYLQALAAATGAEFRVLAVRKGQELMGGIGLYRTQTSYGPVVEPCGGLYYNGLVLRDFATKYPSKATYNQIEIVNSVIDSLAADHYAALKLSNRPELHDIRPFLWQGWGIWPQYTYQVPLTDLNLLWDRCEQNARRLINRCERMGMYVAECNDFDAFYAIYHGTYERKGLAPYFDRSHFYELYHTLQSHESCRLYFAHSAEGEPLATQLVLLSAHPVTHTWAAGADPSALRSGASAFLRWKVFEALHRQGYAYNDLTDATIEEVAKFKSQFGGDLLPCYLVYKVNSKALQWRRRLGRYRELVERQVGRLHFAPHTRQESIAC